MNENHTEGVCHCCSNETMVRYKNIYHMGSEGLEVCQPCENKIVKFVRGLRTETFQKILKEKQNKKMLEKDNS